MADRVEARRAAGPARPVEVRAEDACRLGLVPVVRRVWAPKGQRPVAPHRIEREWLYAYGFVRPGTADTFWLLLPEVTTEWMSRALAEWVRWADPGGRKRRVLVVDRAGWHTSGKLVVPSQVELVELPPGTPELPPAESAWPRVRAAVANRAFAGLDARTAKAIERCRWFMEHPETVRGVVGDDWAAALNQ